MQFDVIFYYDAERVLASETKSFENASAAEAFVSDLFANTSHYIIRSGAKTHIVQLAHVAKIELVDRALQEEKMVLDIL